jgi:hypothetical protein
MYPMKRVTLYLLTLVLCAAAAANPGPQPAAASTASATASKVMMNAGAVRFQFNKTITGQDHKDSVLIIFDRFDHTGAGVVYQKFAADDEQGITLPQVPAGKYYVVIQCLGVHHDRLERVVNIKARKNEKVRIALGDSEEFSKNGVVIPADRFNFADMAVLKTK